MPAGGAGTAGRAAAAPPGLPQPAAAGDCVWSSQRCSMGSTEWSEGSQILNLLPESRVFFSSF